MAPPHEHFMQMAIDQAIVAGQMGEVPVGAVIVDADNQVLAQDHNRTISSCDPSAHAEINVLRSAARRIKNYRLLSTTLYVSIEPCAMCMGAIVHARVKTVVFGAPDPKWGAAGQPLPPRSGLATQPSGRDHTGNLCGPLPVGDSGIFPQTAQSALKHTAKRLITPFG